MRGERKEICVQERRWASKSGNKQVIIDKRDTCSLKREHGLEEQVNFHFI